MADAGAERIAAVRHFNRFYTRRIGVLHEGLLASPFSLAEVRVLYELAHRPGVTARDLARDLGLDGGYLSRILQGFARRKLVSRGTSAADARQRPLTLTPEGRRTFAPLDRRSHEEVAALLAPLADSEQDRLAGAMQTIERLLEPGAADAPFVLRSHRPGDMGWVIARTASSIGANTDGTSASRHWSHTLPPSSSRSSIRSANDAGSRNATASGSGRCSWSESRQR